MPKYIVRVLRKNSKDNGIETDQIYEQGFDDFDIGKLALFLNKKENKKEENK